MGVFVYAFQNKQVAENYTSSGSANTPIDFLFIKPGATRPVGLLSLRTQGKGAGLTALSGIEIRVEQWTSTAASGGTSTTPAPVNNLAPAAAASMGMGAGGGTGAVVSGTGGPNFVGGCGMGASGPGGWVAPNPDAPPLLDGNANKSTDLFSASGTVSMNFGFSGEIVEV
jgi:hypothetical protein